MSETWWHNSHTTQGHGIYSQYKPDHLKEWISKETRRQGRATSPEKFFEPLNSVHRSSLNIPIPSEHIEHRHHAFTKTLPELRQYQQPPVDTTGLQTKRDTSPTKAVEQPLRSEYLPHLVHHHHFGWNPPTPQARYAVVDSRLNFYKMGTAQRYNQDVFHKSTLITTRKA